MDQAKLIKAKEYFELTSSGTPKREAAMEIYGKKGSKDIEQTPEYLAIVSAASQLQKEELKKDIENVKRKQIKAYSKLLDKGEEIMEEAETIQDKVLAQQNQRANLSTGVIENAIAWDGEDRNQNDLSNVLEGVVI